jgi:hypothetical protein
MPSMARSRRTQVSTTPHASRITIAIAMAVTAPTPTHASEIANL